MADYQTQQVVEQEQETSTQTTTQTQTGGENSVAQENLANQQAIPPELRSPYDEVFTSNQERADTMQVGLSESQLQEMQVFMDNWDRNSSRYQTVAQATGMPARLIAAIHWREASGNFNTYLHQGDPLGRPAVHWPTNIPTFYEWEEAAIHALNMKDSLQAQLEITQETTDFARLATFAEAYNGLGYHRKGKPSPYVYSGTSEYSSGKYVADGVYRENAVDAQLGVMPMLGALGGVESENDLSPQLIDEEFAWQRVLSGVKLLRQGAYGIEVTALQNKLRLLKFELSNDGDFGPGTKREVMAFQRSRGIQDDGVVGAGTASEIEKALAENSEELNVSSATAG